MAKKIDNGEGEVIDSGSTTTKPEVVTSTKNKDITPFVDQILKSYPMYETLFIDTQGGVYTSDTPETIRGNAALYNNPHFKP